MKYKIMKKLLVTMVGIVFIATACLYANTAIITGLEGKVTFVKKGAADWQEASMGTILAEGDKVSSKTGSWAELSFKTGHKAKLGSNSYMLIKSAQNKTEIELFKGNLLNKVKKLTNIQSYSIITPQAVCAVRGTEFKVNLGNAGNTSVLVYEGSVSAKELVTGTEVIIPAGKYTIVLKNQPPKEPDDLENYEEPAPEEGQNEEGEEEGEEEAEGEEEDEEGEEEEEAEGEQEEELDAAREELRQEMREAVVDIRTDIVSAREVIEDTKENDSATGRTLKDIHGNLVRIEQYLLRPEPNTLQFLNIAKRSDYRYNGRMNVDDTGARIDSLEATVSFNREMPEQISDWVSYVQEIEDQNIELHPTEIRVITKNDDDSIEMTSKWVGSDEDGDLDDPVVKLISGKEGTWILDTKDYEEGDALELSDDDKGTGVFWVGEDGFETWAVSDNMRIFKDSSGGTKNIYDSGERSELIRMGTESWVIDNDGNLFSLDSLADTGEAVTPFSLIRNIAFETSLVVRTGVSNSLLDTDELDEDSLSDGDYADILSDFNRGDEFFKNNIDLVVTPDIILPVVESAIKTMENLDIGTGSDDDSSSDGL